MAFTENFRRIEFNPDKEIREIFRATQGDTKSQGFNVVVVLGGKKKVITTETMSFVAQKPDGTRVADMAIKDGDGFKIELKNQVFAVPGVVVCTLVLRGANGEKLAGKKFKISVAGSMEDGAIISEDEREILDRAFDLATDIVPRLEGLDVPWLENVNNELETKADKDYVDGQDALKADKTYTDEQLALKADLSEIETARGTESTLGARLDADKAALESKVDKIAVKDGYTPVKGVDYFDGEKGEKGDKGEKGEDGYTPIKGVDYFDGEKGDKGDKGDKGNDGSDANVTNANVLTAIGYTPANVTNVPTKTSELENNSGFLTSVTKSDVGLGNVDNIKQMPISGGILENYREKLATLSEANGSINLNLGNVFQHTPSGNTTYSITNAVNGQAHSFTLIVNMGSTVRTLTFPASVKWQGGEIPDMSAANKTYVLTFLTVDGGTTWFGMFGGEF